MCNETKKSVSIIFAVIIGLTRVFSLETEAAPEAAIQSEKLLNYEVLAQASRYVPGRKQIVLFSSEVPDSMLPGNVSERQATPSTGGMIFDGGDPILQKADADMPAELNSAQPASASVDNIDQGPQKDLPDILKAAAEYCRRLENSALDFVCLEEITEKINRSREIRADAPGVRYSTRAGETFRKPAPVLTPFATNTYVYDYQFIRKDGRLKETRTLLEENRKKKTEKNAKLKTINFVYQNALLGPIGVLGERWQPDYDYKITGEESVDGRSVLIIDAIPKAPNPEIRFLYGKIRIDKQTKDILEISWNQERIGNFEVFEKRGYDYNAEPQISIISEFNIAKNGIRFPSKLKVEEAYLDKSGSKFVRSVTTVTYRDFRYFTVEVDRFFD